MSIEERKAKLLRAKATSPRVSWGLVLDALRSGKCARRAAWMTMDVDAQGVVNSGPSAICSRWFEGVDGSAHLCFVTNATPHPCFEYAPTFEDMTATDWIVTTDKDLM